MYLDALSFLEDERDGFRPFEALAELSDEDLDRPIEGAHGWSARDLMAHLLQWQEYSLAAAKELAVGEHAPSVAKLDADWDARGDRLNDDYIEDARRWPVEELRARFRTVPGDLRGYLTVVPESRWIKHAANQRFFYEETLEHYDDHRPELEAILAAAGRRPA
jgi:hypothetical protein